MSADLWDSFKIEGFPLINENKLNGFLLIMTFWVECNNWKRDERGRNTPCEEFKYSKEERGSCN